MQERRKSLDANPRPADEQSAAAPNELQRTSNRKQTINIAIFYCITKSSTSHPDVQKHEPCLIEDRQLILRALLIGVELIRSDSTGRRGTPAPHGTRKATALPIKKSGPSGPLFRNPSREENYLRKGSHKQGHRDKENSSEHSARPESATHSVRAAIDSSGLPKLCAILCVPKQARC